MKRIDLMVGMRLENKLVIEPEDENDRGKAVLRKIHSMSDEECKAFFISSYKRVYQTDYSIYPVVSWTLGQFLDADDDNQDLFQFISDRIEKIVKKDDITIEQIARIITEELNKEYKTVGNPFTGDDNLEVAHKIYYYLNK